MEGSKASMYFLTNNGRHNEASHFLVIKNMCVCYKSILFHAVNFHLQAKTMCYVYNCSGSPTVLMQLLWLELAIKFGAVVYLLTVDQFPLHLCVQRSKCTEHVTDGQELNRNKVKSILRYL